MGSRNEWIALHSSVAHAANGLKLCHHSTPHGMCVPTADHPAKHHGKAWWLLDFEQGTWFTWMTECIDLPAISQLMATYTPTVILGVCICLCPLSSNF